MYLIFVLGLVASYVSEVSSLSLSARRASLTGAPLETGELNGPWADDEGLFEDSKPRGFNPLDLDFAECQFAGQPISFEPYYIKPWDATPENLHNYKALFDKWNGKQVIFAGDSLMREVWQVIGCAANLLGANTTTTMVEKIHPLPQGEFMSETVHQPNKYHEEDEKMHEAGYKNLAATMGKMEVRFGTMQFDMYNMYFFHIESRTSALQRQKELMITYQYLAKEVKKRHYAYANLGHATLLNSYTRDENVTAVYEAVSLQEKETNETNAGLAASQQMCQDKFAQAIDAVSGLTTSVSFIEHPPSHFKRTRVGDWFQKDFSGCGCLALQNLKSQFNYECERGAWIDNYLKNKRNVHLAKWFEDMAPYCDKHYPNKGDCRHYHINPTLHDGLVASMLKLA